MRNDRQHLEQVMAAVMLGYHAQVREFVLPALEGWLTYATIVTQRGTVVVEFFGADTPLTVGGTIEARLGWRPPVPTREEARTFSRIRLSPNWTDITRCLDTSARDSMCSTPLCRAIESLA